MYQIKKRNPFLFIQFYFLSFIGISVFSTMCLAEISWQELKGKHFIIYYEETSDRNSADTVLNYAEKYYEKTGSQIGYKRHSDFWTWDQRAKIYLFPDQSSFVEQTGQPLWSLGYAARDEQLFKSRAIVTYKQERSLLNELLPHEISHLIIHDFFSWADVPMWLDEGISQLQESGKTIVADSFMKFVLTNGKHIPFNIFVNYDIKKEVSTQLVELFYAQSISVVDFLIKKYGDDAFRRFCRSLRDGKGLEDALKSSYNNRIQTLSDLENQWLTFMGK